MKDTIKTCRYCGKNFDTHDKGRIVLEFWRKPKQLSRGYFCCRNCFVSFLKENKIVQ